MCRNKEHGGRRCPSSDNPIKRDIQNARKRLQYHAKKAGRELTHGEILDMNDHMTSSTPSVSQNIHQGFHLSKNDLTEEIEKGYHTSHTLSGIIDYRELDKDSYKGFGFQEIDYNWANFKKERISQSYTLTTDYLYKKSNDEIQNLSNIEKQALRYFTTHNHQWINHALYSESFYQGLQKTKGTKKPLFNEKKSNIKELNWPIHESQEEFNEITPVLDEALSKGPQNQKIVYRGISVLSDSMSEKNIDEWFNEDLPLGKEIVFDGYHSSSPDFGVGLSFAEGGLLFEILTPEGINISKISRYSTEREILLPRGSRYMVVGKHHNFTNTDQYSQNIKIVQLVAINDQGEILDGTNGKYNENFAKAV